MPAKAPVLTSDLQCQLALLGERLRVARLRRGNTAAAVAEQAGITRVTLARLEGGDGATTVGNLLKVLAALGLQGDADLLALDAEMAAAVPAQAVLARRAPSRIRLKTFPQLRNLAWHIKDADTELTPEEAFALYERNWRHVEVERILPREHALIDHLKATVGRGVMLV